jgi:DNA polymerase III subunit gamma/tau
MNSMNLANTHRPTTLDEMLLDPMQQKMIESWINSKSFPTAILISGLYGVGKTTLARILERFIVCRTHDLCGKCKGCQHQESGHFQVNMMLKNSVTDVKKIVAYSEHRSLLRERNQAFICDEVQGLSSQGQGAWLSSLEEPTNHPSCVSHWILVTSSSDSLLPAIRSRCRRIELIPPTDEQLVQKLTYIAEKEGLDLTAAMQPLFLDIAQKSGGHVRDAVMSLEAVLPLLLGGEDPNSLKRLIYKSEK